MKNKLHLVKVLLFVCIGLFFSGYSVVYNQKIDASSLGGLVFSGNHKFPISPYRTKNEDRLTEKTQLFVSKEKQLNLKGKYSIAFRASFWYNFAFGYIFEVVNKKYTINFLFDHHPDSSNIYLCLIFNNESSPISFPFKRSEVYDGKWFDFRFDIDEVEGTIVSKINGVSKKFKTKSFLCEEGSDITFGAGGSSTDCAPLILKDLRISIDGALEHRYLFTEMEGSTAYDSEGDLDAKVINHEWLINQHYKTAKNDSFYIKTNGILNLSLHKTRNEMIINRADAIKIYNFSFRTFTNIPFDTEFSDKNSNSEYLSSKYLSDTVNWNSSSITKEDSKNNLRYFLYRYPQKEVALIKIFSIRTPVLTSLKYNELYENSLTRVHERYREIYNWLFIGFGMLIIPFVGYFGKKIVRRRREFSEKEKNFEEKQTIIKEYPRSSYISIFGKLKLVDSNGINYADALAPKLKELLAMIVFFSAGNKDSSPKSVKIKLLEEIFWYNVKSENLKNNRNVAFTNIRKAMKGFEDVTLTVKGNEVSLIYSGNISNKVEEYFNLVEYLSSSESSSDEAAFAIFAGIVGQGIALAELHSEWADNTRTILRSKVICILERYMEILFNRNDYESCIKIADISIVHDPLHEETLKYKIKSLIRLEEKLLASEFYKLFCQRYYKMYKEEYPFEFEELIEG